MDGREDETLDNGESSYHRFLKGDTDGLTELVDAYYDSLVLYLDTILHNIQDAEDCAEETIIVLTTKKPVFRGSSSFKTWLFSIGRNLARKRLKSERFTVSVPTNDLDGVMLSEQDVAGDYLVDEEKKILYKCLQNLKPLYREIVWLKFFEEMPMKDIAKTTGKTVYSVKHMASRALDALRMEMRKKGYYERS